MELWTFNLEKVTDSGTKKNVLGVKEPKLSLGTIDSQCSSVHWIRAIHEWSILSIILWSIVLSYFRSSKQAHKTTTKWEKPHQHTCNTMNRDKKYKFLTVQIRIKLLKISPWNTLYLQIVHCTVYVNNIYSKFRSFKEKKWKSFRKNQYWHISGILQKKKKKNGLPNKLRGLYRNSIFHCWGAPLADTAGQPAGSSSGSSCSGGEKVVTALSGR